MGSDRPNSILPFMKMEVMAPTAAEEEEEDNKLSFPTLFMPYFTYTVVNGLPPIHSLGVCHR